MTLTELLVLAVAGMAVSQWWHSRDAKAVALIYAAQRCESLGLQLLDQSIVLKKSRLMRGSSGWLQWWREYSFEFSATGTERYHGQLTLAGHQLQTLELDPYITFD